MSWFSEVLDRRTLKKAYKWGKKRALHKKRVFLFYLDKFPDMPKDELYFHVVSSGRYFNENTAALLISDEQNAVDKRSFCLRNVIKRMLVTEARYMWGLDFSLSNIDIWDILLEANTAVDDVIPEHL